MFSRLRPSANSEPAVLSLAVQAAIYTDEHKERSQFQVLLRHFLDRFFNNETSTSEGEAKGRLLQIIYAIALPGVCVALFLFPPYHYPGGRPFWSQVCDHYFYVLYSFVATGVITIFVWDLFFPDKLDVFVLSTLSIERRSLFFARLSAVFLFLGTLLLGANALGTVFFPASADLPSLTRHLFAHFIATTMSGVFIAAALIALQGVLLILLGETVFRRISPFIQGLAITALLLSLLLFPVVSRFMQALIGSGERMVSWFPPLWFLGVYERLLNGPNTLPAFTALARTGCLTTLLALAFASATYPLAYRSRMRSAVEGSVSKTSSRWTVRPIATIFAGWMYPIVARSQQSRGIFQFIGQTLLRTPRYRVYLAMYGGLGLALIIAGALVLKVGGGRVGFALSVDGLRAVVPIAAFWTIAGLRAAFLAPADRRINWMFRVIQGRPGRRESAATRTWVLISALVLTLSLVFVIAEIAPPTMRNWESVGLQTFIAASLSVLLTDIFFLNVTTVPFSGGRPSSSMNLAYILIQYFGLFPPFVLLVLSLEDWLGKTKAHWAVVLLGAVILHWQLKRRHAASLRDAEFIAEVDNDEDEFPQRLGLRY